MKYLYKILVFSMFGFGPLLAVGTDPQPSPCGDKIGSNLCPRIANLGDDDSIGFWVGFPLEPRADTACKYRDPKTDTSGDCTDYWNNYGHPTAKDSANIKLWIDTLLQKYDIRDYANHDHKITEPHLNFGMWIDLFASKKTIMLIVQESFVSIADYWHPDNNPLDINKKPSQNANQSAPRFKSLYNVKGEKLNGYLPGFIKQYETSSF